MLALYGIGVIVIALLDQLTKLAVLRYVRPVETIPLLENIFHLTYCENRGAAFGILQNRFGLFFCITIFVLVAVTVYMVVKRPRNLCFNLSVTMLVGGALGNLIDRIFRGFVVDFFDFRLIHFAIFNVADCFVVCGAILLAWYMIFVDGKTPQNTPRKPKTKKLR